ncbi:class I SAM-dependent methyltransferase [Phenylobacterium aquaticum]|uniref:class I SAM-dependent methyltransferase n=1 Tax=Phenylobacterium aquaticum TaxID=1763816 RepID=UPI001F5D1033|nr:class I SAM-dependent methyltransferase [Phenylobacterium aquaticum]MCI3134726.1 class I SAM-dependent methyltransferase [Phenylobacterium aquaticum]
MTARTSNWIPSRRIRQAGALALGLAAAAAVGALWSPLFLLLLIPALGAGWATFVMMRIRDQLSPGRGDWERRIHQSVVARLAPPPDAQADLLDIGCGDGSLLIALLDDAPGLVATGVDFWGRDWDYAQAACEARLAKQGCQAVFRRMDAARLEFADERFDLVVSVMCFHEVRAPVGAARRGPVAAVAEALRVLKPGGRFVFIDRFADRADYGDLGDLQAVLAPVLALRREPLVAALGIPWPLNTRRAMGPVEMVSGRKSTAP